MKLTINDLKKVRFFDDYTDDQLKTIASMSAIREFKVKDIIFEQYDELSEVYVLLEGSLSLGISLAKEKRIHLGTIEEGQLFSWSAVFSPIFQQPGLWRLHQLGSYRLTQKNLIKKLKKIVISGSGQCQKLRRRSHTGLVIQGFSL